MLILINSLNFFEGHYKKHHYKVFYQSQVEEKVYEPGIFVTSQRFVKLHLII